MVHKFVRWITQNLSLLWGDRLLTRLPKYFTASEQVVTYSGISLKINTGEEIGKRIYYYGKYEPEQEEALVQYLKPGAVFFDLGANIGVFSILGARGRAKVYAFEPSRKVGRRLGENIKLNSEEHNITVVPAAVADKSGSLDFYETRDGNWGVGRIFDFNPSVQSEKYQVPVKSLDEFAREFGRPDFIKIDIEGAEWLVLNGAKETLAKGSPTVLIEFHPREISSLGGSVEKCVGILEEFGYHPQLKGKAISPKTHSWQVYQKSGTML